MMTSTSNLADRVRGQIRRIEEAGDRPLVIYANIATIRKLLAETDPAYNSRVAPQADALYFDSVPLRAHSNVLVGAFIIIKEGDIHRFVNRQHPAVGEVQVTMKRVAPDRVSMHFEIIPADAERVAIGLDTFNSQLPIRVETGGYHSPRIVVGMGIHLIPYALYDHYLLCRVERNKDAEHTPAPDC